MSHTVSIGPYKTAKPPLVVGGQPQIQSFYKFGSRAPKGLVPNLQSRGAADKMLMGSDKYFKLRDVNLGPKDIAAVAKQKFDRKMTRGNNPIIDEASEMTQDEQLQLWGEYEREYGDKAGA